MGEGEALYLEMNEGRPKVSLQCRLLLSTEGPAIFKFTTTNNAFCNKTQAPILPETDDSLRGNQASV